MLARQPADRFDTPAQIAAALEPLASEADLASLLERADRAELTATDDQSSVRTREHLTADSKETKPSVEHSPSSHLAEQQPTEAPTTVDWQSSHLAPRDEPSRHDVTLQTTQAARSTSSPTGSSRRSVTATFLATVAALLAFAALTTIVIQTDKGDIKIVSNDPDIEVTVRRNGQVVDGFELKQRPDATSYFSGDYEIELKGGKPDGVVINNGVFKLTRGNTELVTITREAKLAAKPTPPIAKAPFDAAEARQYQKTWAEHLGIPSELEIELPTNQKLTLVLIPPGEFLMGSTDEEQTRLLAEAQGDRAAIRSISTEGPSRQVQITQPFYLGKYEVTKAQWQAAMGGDPATLKSDRSHPVDDVNWDEIPPFLAKLNEGASRPRQSCYSVEIAIVLVLFTPSGPRA
jgi:hypothetical protein